MEKQANGSVVFTRAEFASLAKLVDCVHDRTSTLSSNGDFLGWNTYYALQMWDEKLHGRTDDDLADYLESEEEDENDDEKKKGNPQTVDEWLDAYGQTNKGGSRGRVERKGRYR